MIRTPLEVSLENGRKIVDFRCGGSFGVILDGKPFTYSLSMRKGTGGELESTKEKRERCVLFIKDVKSCRGHRIRLERFSLFSPTLLVRLGIFVRSWRSLISRKIVYERKESGYYSQEEFLPFLLKNQQTSLCLSSLSTVTHSFSYTQSNLLTSLFLFTTLIN